MAVKALCGEVNLLRFEKISAYAFDLPALTSTYYYRALTSPVLVLLCITLVLEVTLNTVIFQCFIVFFVIIYLLVTCPLCILRFNRRNI